MLSSRKIISGLVCFLFLTNCSSKDVANYCHIEGGKIVINDQRKKWGGYDFGGDLYFYKEGDVEFLFGPFTARVIRDDTTIRLEPVYTAKNESFIPPIVETEYLSAGPRTTNILVTDRGLIDGWTNYFSAEYSETFKSCGAHKASLASIFQ